MDEVNLPHGLSQKNKDTEMTKFNNLRFAENTPF